MAYSIDFYQKALEHYAKFGNLSETARTSGIANQNLTNTK